MLGPLAIPPRLIARALEDLHTLAEALRELTRRDGELSSLLESVRQLPPSEDELSANIAALREDVQALLRWLEPLHGEVRDLDQTAKELHASMDTLQALLKKVPGI
jgi:chromosome segregation ATPase